ncbi:hypothetical protein [Superficieibacter sp. HKU1]|uniref:hypothetical protein n=1 Tax=Superficieibacter sp. HKU1 TaxID=3031919 RepID=UPI0023E34E09|nr:hypothetical protein [Superficieibacter sp. HKU1]WES70544.1 hypothetical protein P0H77_11480 [Superficieibacter sp. HKU1]
MKYQGVKSIVGFVLLGPLFGFMITITFYLFVVPDVGYFLERVFNESGFILLCCYVVGSLPALATGLCYAFNRETPHVLLSTTFIGAITSCLLSVIASLWLAWMMRLPVLYIIPLFALTGGLSALGSAFILNLLMGKPTRRHDD